MAPQATVPRTIDVHAHILSEETIRLLQREAPKVAPKLTEIDEQFGTLDVAGSVYRQFPARRLGSGAAARGHGGLQGRHAGALGLPADLCLCAAAGAGGGVRAHSERAAGQAGQGAPRPLPRHRDAADAGSEARRRRAPSCDDACSACAARRSAPMSPGKNLDDPELEPVWATAAELDAFILVHPINVAGIDRLSSYYLNNLIGNPLDTTIAAACLVFSGVLERYPVAEDLPRPRRRVRALPGRALRARLACAHGAQDASLRKPPTESLERFYFDTIVHSKEVLEFLVGTAGADRVLLGSDYPFDMGMPDGVLQVRGLSIPAARAGRHSRRAGAGPARARGNFGARSRLKRRSIANEKDPRAGGSVDVPTGCPHPRRHARRRRRISVRPREGQPHPGRPRLFDRQRRLRRGRPHDRRIDADARRHRCRAAFASQRAMDLHPAKGHSGPRSATRRSRPSPAP